MPIGVHSLSSHSAIAFFLSEGEEYYVQLMESSFCGIENAASLSMSVELINRRYSICKMEILSFHTKVLDLYYSVPSLQIYDFEIKI